MTKWKPLTLTAVIAASLGQVAAADVNFDGLYYPAGADRQDWNCNADFIGQDGGALAIGAGYLDGLENRCELTAPVAGANGSSIRYTAICSAEGETYSEPVTITKTASGVGIGRNGSTVFWAACPSAVTTTAAPAATGQGSWVFANGVASISAGGKYLEFGCAPLTASSTHPTARMVECSTCFPNDEVAYRFSFDGGEAQVFTFTKLSNAEGMTSDLDYYPSWFDDNGIIPRLMAGTQLDVSEGNAVIASYPLRGSSAALAALRSKCN